MTAAFRLEQPDGKHDRSSFRCGEDAASRALKSEAAAFTLLVDARNDRAVTFYERFGFRTLASRPRTLFRPLATAEKVFIQGRASGQGPPAIIEI